MNANSSQNIPAPFPVEVIDDDQKLFYRIHRNNIDHDIVDRKEKIRPVAFDPKPSPHSVQMSVNWEKYSSAEATRLSAPKPELNGVLSFISGKIRISPVNLNVTHSPTQRTNRSHSHIHDVLSKKNDPEIRLLLRDSCEWEIDVN